MDAKTLKPFGLGEGDEKRSGNRRKKADWSAETCQKAICAKKTKKNKNFTHSNRSKKRKKILRKTGGGMWPSDVGNYRLSIDNYQLPISSFTSCYIVIILSRKKSNYVIRFF